MEFHKNVVVTNAEGETFRSDELIWDQVKKSIYSNKRVQMTMKGGDLMYGDNFKSSDDLTHPIFGKATGTIHVAETQQ